MLTLNIGMVEGLPDSEQAQLNKLVKIYNYHMSRNIRKRRYYNGKISLSEVNLGIALPKGFKDLDIGCAWGAKTVDVLASRSMFDGFVSGNSSSFCGSICYLCPQGSQGIENCQNHDAYVAEYGFPHGCHTQSAETEE